MTDEADYWIHDTENNDVAIKTDLGTTVLPSVYPSEYFAEIKTKPPIELIYGANDITVLRSHILQTGASDVIDADVAAAYLYVFFGNEKHKLKKEWTSFGRKIGGEGEEISIKNLALYNISKGTIPDHTSKSTELSSSNAGIAYFICYVYRLIHTRGTPEYRSQVAERLAVQLLSAGGDKLYLGGTDKTYSIWANHENLGKMVAIIDMFYTHFPESQYASVKMGTLITRWKDSSAIVTYYQMVESLGLEHPLELATWIYLPSSARDVTRLLKDGQELFKTESYTPYLSSLKMSPRSPYSTTLNPSFHRYIHTVGAILGSVRSMNAVMVGDVDIMGIMTCAKVVAYAFRKTIQASRRFRGKDDRIAPDDDEEEGEYVDFGTEPTVRHSLLWYKYFEHLKFQVSPQMEAYARSRFEKMKDCRDNSIGAFLYSHRDS